MSSSASRFKIDLTDMARHVECPICLEIPRDGVMLQCVNGHNLCETCWYRLGRDARCPFCRCGYHNPPVVNTTVADLIESLPFEITCKFAANAGDSTSKCDHVGTTDVIGRHERTCAHRRVPCPSFYCQGMGSVSADRVVQHFAAVHGLSARRNDSEPVVIVKHYQWKAEFGSSSARFSWFTRPYETRLGVFFPCAHFCGGQIYIFVRMVAHGRVAENFGCGIKAGKAESALCLEAPVYPIDWNLNKILEHCDGLSAATVGKMLTENPNEDDKKNGYGTRFKVTFKIVNNTTV